MVDEHKTRAWGGGGLVGEGAYDQARKGREGRARRADWSGLEHGFLLINPKHSCELPANSQPHPPHLMLHRLCRTVQRWTRRPGSACRWVV